VYLIKKTNSERGKDEIYVVHAIKQLNKFKKVKFLKTHNLLTGETSATPEQIKVSQIIFKFIVYFDNFFFSVLPTYLIVCYFKETIKKSREKTKYYD